MPTCTSGITGTTIPLVGSGSLVSTQEPNLGAITLALATGVYAMAQALNLSGPIAVVVAGQILGLRLASRRPSTPPSTLVASKP